MLTGASGSGKTTLSRALIDRLIEYGLDGVVLIDRRTDSEAEWSALVKEAAGEVESGKVVVIAAAADRASMRAVARKRLKPFFEVHLEGAAGGANSYERTDPVELRIDTAHMSAEEAAAILVQQVLDFLATPANSDEPPGEWVRRRVQHLIANGPQIDLPGLRSWLLRQAKKTKPVICMRRPSCAQLMVIYGGMDAFLGTQGTVNDMSPLDFLKASGLFGRNLAWIRDPYGENFQRGVSEELPDVETLAQWTREYTRSLPHVREVHAVGYSSGAYGAMLFGHLCQMQSVWAFSPRCAKACGTWQRTACCERSFPHSFPVTEEKG